MPPTEKGLAMNYRAIEAVVKGVVPVVREHIRENSEPLTKRIDEFEAALAKRVEALEKQTIVVEALEKALGAAGGQIVSLLEKWGDMSERLRVVEARQPERGENGKDGADADPALVEKLVGEAVAALPPPANGRDGKDADPELIAKLVSDAVGALPLPKDGKDGVAGQDGAPGKDADQAAIEQLIEQKLAALPPPKDGRPGKDGADADPHEIAAILEPVIGVKLAELVEMAISQAPVPKDGRDGVGITTAWVDADGKLSMTLSDGSTHVVGVVKGDDGRDGRDGLPGGPPGGPGPIGLPGNDGKSIEYLDTWDREKTYVEGNMVTWDGSMWACKSETAGTMPGKTDAWRLAVKKGTPGREGRGIKSAKVDDDGQLVITYTDDTVHKAGRVKGDPGPRGRDFEPI